MKTKMFLGLISLAILSLNLSSCSNNTEMKAEMAEQKQIYETIIVAEQNAILESVYPVTIKGQEDIEIRPRVDGFIEAIYVDEGSVVKKGQSLFKINSPQSEQALATAQANVNSAEARLNTSKLDVDRIRPLAEKGILSDVQLQTYENAYQSALASLKQAEASLKQAEATLKWTNVTSPVDGVIGTIAFRQGSLVNSANVLTTVANINNVFAYFSVNEKELMGFLDDIEGKNQLEKIKNLPKVTLTLADGSVYDEKGKVETISGIVNVSTGSVNFRAEFSNKQGLLRSGSSGKIMIPKEIENVFVIPQKATFAQQNKTLVYKVENDSVVQTVISVKAMPVGKNYAVIDGLEKGDRIVTEGIATLNNGKKIAYNDNNDSNKTVKYFSQTKYNK